MSFNLLNFFNSERHQQRVQIIQKKDRRVNGDCDIIQINHNEASIFKYNISYKSEKNTMFIMINFGYKFKKFFTIDCLAAALFDCIWEMCYKELRDIYDAKEQLFTKQISNHQKKIETQQKKLQQINEKVKQEQLANPDKKKDDKKGAKKGGKQTAALSPLEQQKFDTEKSLEFSKNALIKYNQKITKIGDLKNKAKQWNQKLQKEVVYAELVDKSGERKFVKTKLTQQANQFLSDRTAYYLCLVKQEGEEEDVQPIVHEGFPIRTVEEDVLITNEQPVFTMKKDDKAKKGGKKK